MVIGKDDESKFNKLDDIIDNWFNDDYESGYLNLDIDEDIDETSNTDFDDALDFFNNLSQNP